MISRCCCCRQHRRRSFDWTWRMHKVAGKYICHDCYMQNDNLFLSSSFADRHPTLTAVLVVGYAIFAAIPAVVMFWRWMHQ